MVTVERIAMMVQLEEREHRFPPTDLSPDRDMEERRAMNRGEEAVMDLDRVEDTADELRARR